MISRGKFFSPAAWCVFLQAQAPTGNERFCSDSLENAMGNALKQLWETISVFLNMFSNLAETGNNVILLGKNASEEALKSQARQYAADRKAEEALLLE